MAAVRALRSVDMAVTDLAEAVRFFVSVWHLDLVARVGNRAYLKGTGAFHHILVLHEQSRPAIVRIVLDAASPADVAALHAAVSASGVGPVEQPASWDEPGGGFGFGFQDPEGRNFAVVCGVADDAAGADAPDRPRCITHANLNAGDGAGTAAFLMTVLGFKLSDESSTARFLRCNRAHNALVIGKKGPPTLNHLAFEMPDLESVMRGAGRLRDNGHPIEWGVGRHGPGNNVFAYFLGPEEMPLEYTAEVMMVGDDHVARGPEHWTWPAGRADQWGVTEPLSKRFQRVQGKFHFTGEGYSSRR